MPKTVAFGRPRVNLRGMFSENELTRRSRSRLWKSALDLPGALGTATLVSMVLVVHDATTAGRRGNGGEGGSQSSGVDCRWTPGDTRPRAFAPAAPWETRSSVSTPVALNALVHAQRGAAQCRCRDTLPADVFFQYDVKAGTLNFSTTATPSAPAIVAVARAAAERSRGGHGQGCISTRARRSATRVL